ncbi:MAG: fructose-bisphosphate aldolase class I [Myxococcales bacterium]|nr:fructose-bisphosphate aldolase class I [Myxococcales bacterium]
MSNAVLVSTIEKIVSGNKGILAADESTNTVQKRLAGVGVESTNETRRDWRNLLFSCADAAPFIGGAILYDETIRQNAADGTPLTEILRQHAIVPGIKVDTGAKHLAGSRNETITEGLDGLRDRLAEYRELGAGFAKWRAVINIGEGRPSTNSIQANAHALARYAALCQEANIVPIVEPEVMMTGGHSIETCYQVTESTLKTVFSELNMQRVDLEGILLKPNMVISGKDCPTQASSERVAELTIRCFSHAVPAIVPACVFLSGGQTEVQATENLQAINASGQIPWIMSFSYGRALQESALKTWAGDASKVDAAQRAYAHRARCNAAAAGGTYNASLELEQDNA